MNMTKNLLVVFGGTTQSNPQKIFTDAELSSNSVDVLQINLLTINSNITFTTNNNEHLNKKWLEAEPSGLLRKLKVTIKLKDLDDNANDFLSKLDEMGKVIEKINWSHSNYTENSDARGMTVEAFNDFSQASQGLILKFLIYLKKINYEYENVFILAHSRGCSLAINALSKFDQGDELDNVLISKIKRVVLLDPVGKNVNNTDETIIPKNAETIKYLSEIGKEIHIVVKSESTNYDYESYADILVGTKQGGHIDSNIHNSPDMRNVYVHIAHMAHEGMLAEKFRHCFSHYNKIIDTGAWKIIYSNEKEVDINLMKESPALKAYIKGDKSASEIDPEPEDVFYEFFNQFQIKSITGSLKDRRRAFVHCVAKKIIAIS
ncbi:alpha/beta hydrolase [Okeanomitos corallinicola TIOX110]|uniref:Alpha/beta hydrolase n=1 Tax=Okeanomitos corallinicola TIOX110 TaxID=3133117 RepID=A0ABZ2V0G8_9CYAN